MRSEELIPGARDETTLTHREPGAIGGNPYGADIPAEPPQWEDETTRRLHEREGGGTRKSPKLQDPSSKLQDPRLQADS